MVRGFRMVSFPVKLCTAARSQTIRFHRLHPCGRPSRIKQVLQNAEVGPSYFASGHQTPMASGASPSLAGFLIRHDQALLPMVELIEQSRVAIDGLIDCHGTSRR